VKRPKHIRRKAEKSGEEENNRSSLAFGRGDYLREREKIQSLIRNTVRHGECLKKASRGVAPMDEYSLV